MNRQFIGQQILKVNQKKKNEMIRLTESQGNAN